jgi:hypothetical protein
MRRLIVILTAALALLALPASASADFGFQALEVGIVNKDGEPSLQAGSHPFGLLTTLAVNTFEVEGGKVLPEADLKNLTVTTPEGLIADSTAVPSCPTATFIEVVTGSAFCPAETAVGETEVNVAPAPQSPEAGYEFTVAVYNLPPPPGVIARFGFAVENAPVIIDIGVTSQPPYRGQVSLTNISQILQFFGARTTIWGHPSDPAHNTERGKCAGGKGSCPVEELKKPLLTSPRSCTGPLQTDFLGVAWNSGQEATGSAFSPAMTNCAKLGFAPSLDVQPTNHSAEGPTGLDVDLDVADEGLLDPKGLADSDIKKAVVTLPQGITANPSLAEGLVTCSPQALARETVGSKPGEGCPQASKIGTVEAETPILAGTILKGEVFIASQDDNPFHSLLAFYLVIRDAQRGILVKQAAKIEPDPKTGQLVTTMDNLPQFPLGHVSLHFREGGRSPLITPPGCGTYETKAVFTPWANPDSPLITTSTLQITNGIGGGSCPSGPPPFSPGFQAGSVNNAAASYSPFYTRLTRRDGDQDLTKFSATLPPGMVAKLAGVGKCSDAAIAGAKAKSGRSELVSPSCPPSSEIGDIQAGAGVGSELTYVPGKVYLAGPYNGAPLSVVGIVPAVAGPFDVGTVVTRLALDIDPKTAEARVDGSRSDPIPHILAGIPLKVRDIRVNVDRPDFTLNPTRCSLFSVGAQIWGGGTDLFSAADDSPVSRSEPFRAANCASLGFKSSLKLSLKGGTHRGDHPALKAIYKARPGDANLRSLALTFPRSEFVENANFRTICTRVQFAANACPPDAIYGHVRAFTPLLDEPLEGPVYLRSSDHPLPDAVFVLHGIVDAEVAVRIDSIHGRLRATVESAPDVPVSQVIVEMEGGKKGLFVNSRNICAGKNRANADLVAQSERKSSLSPPLTAKCPKHKHRKQRRHKR